MQQRWERQAESIYLEAPAVMEIVPIVEVDADGILDQVAILGRDFQTTFYRIMQPFGYAEPVRAPVLRVRRPVVSLQTGQVTRLLRAEQSRSRRGGTLVLPH